jgi:hypothetical protein
MKSGAYAVGDLATAGFEVAVAGADAVMGGVIHVEAGLLDAVGADEAPLPSGKPRMGTRTLARGGRRSGRRDGAGRGCRANLVEAGAAVHRPIVAGGERHCRLSAALTADRGVVFARAT